MLRRGGDIFSGIENQLSMMLSTWLCTSCGLEEVREEIVGYVSRWQMDAYGLKNGVDKLKEESTTKGNMRRVALHTRVLISSSGTD